MGANFLQDLFAFLALIKQAAVSNRNTVVDVYRAQYIELAHSLPLRDEVSEGLNVVSAILRRGH